MNIEKKLDVSKTKTKRNKKRNYFKKRPHEIKKFNPVAKKIMLLATDIDLLKKLSSELRKYWNIDIFDFEKEFENKSGVKQYDFFKTESGNRYKEFELEILDDLCMNEKTGVLFYFLPGMLLDSKLEGNFSLYNKIKDNFFKIYLHKDYDENALAQKFTNLPQWKNKEKNKAIEGYAMERKSLQKLADATVDISDVGIKDSAQRISQIISKKN